jgi:hypothetical protein
MLGVADPGLRDAMTEFQADLNAQAKAKGARVGRPD